MNNKYKHTKTTVSLINYHFVFCPRYRRKIFLIEGLEERFKELTLAECKKQKIDVLALECHIDYVHIYVSTLPTISIPDIMKYIKAASTNVLRNEYPELSSMPSLWTRNYFVSTEDNITAETIEWYVESQMTRPIDSSIETKEEYLDMGYRSSEGGDTLTSESKPRCAKNNIAEIRLSQKIDQLQLAKLLNVTKNYISSLENRSDINRITLYRVAKVLNTTEHRIFDYSDREREKPTFNPHMEAFWVEGSQARVKLSASYSVLFVDRLICNLDKEQNESFAPIRDVKLLIPDLYCLVNYANDGKTKESSAEVELAFAGGLVGAEFFLCAALLDKRSDIIFSFFKGLSDTKEFKKGKDGYNNIKTIREQIGLTQSALANKCKINLSSLRLIEKKNYCSDVHLKSAKRIAKVLGCDLSDLFSVLPNDLYNVRAKQTAISLSKKYNTLDLREALWRDMNDIRLCIRDIIGFLNWINAKEIGREDHVKFML